MKAVIQAGGLGTRLRPITYEIPKPLLTVRGKPILDYIIEFLTKHNVNDIGVIVSADYRDNFRKWLSVVPSNVAEKVSLFVETKPAGTFGWLRNLRGWLGQESFVLANGDTLSDFDLGHLNELHNKHKPVATIALKSVENPSDYGTVVLDRDNRITSFIEKPNISTGPSFVSAGFYLLEPSIFDYDDLSKEFVMIERDIFPALVKSKKALGIAMTNSRFYDCGTLERWEKAIQEW